MEKGLYMYAWVSTHLAEADVFLLLPDAPHIPLTPHPPALAPGMAEILTVSLPITYYSSEDARVLHVL